MSFHSHLIVIEATTETGAVRAAKHLLESFAKPDWDFFELDVHDEGLIGGKAAFSYATASDRFVLELEKVEHWRKEGKDTSTVYSVNSYYLDRMGGPDPTKLLERIKQDPHHKKLQKLWMVAAFLHN